MSYIICKSNNVQMDLMVLKKYQPQLVGYMRQYGCTYDREDEWEHKGKKYVVLKDIRGKRGKSLGDVIGLFYSLEWNSLIEGSSEDKFYITMNARRRAKNHADADRTETCEGGDSRNEREPAGNPESGTVGEPAGDGVDAGHPGADHPGRI